MRERGEREKEKDHLLNFRMEKEYNQRKERQQVENSELIVS